MSGASQVIDEYLISLGFRTDASALAKFKNTLGSTGKSILSVGAGVASVMAGVAAAANTYAYSMRKVYFAADVAGTSVSYMRSMGVAAKQAGIEVGTIESAITSMTREVRDNVGKRGLLGQMLGETIDPEKMDGIVERFIKHLKTTMPHEVAVQMANSMFGLDSDTYYMLAKSIDKVTEARIRQQAADKASDIDSAERRREVEEYTAQVDEFAKSFDRVKHSILSGVVPALNDVFHLFQGKQSTIKDFFHEIFVPWKDPRIQKMIDAENSAKNDRGNASPQIQLGASKEATYIMQKMRGMGWGKEQAAAFAANAGAESRFDPAAKGDYKNGKPTSFGLFQWHDERAKAFQEWQKNKYGVDTSVDKSSMDKQLEFADFEMRQRKEFDKFSKANSAYDAGFIFARDFERPASSAQYALRGAEASRLAGESTRQGITVQQQNTITNTISGDNAQQIGDVVGRSSTQALADANRNVLSAIGSR